MVGTDDYNKLTTLIASPSKEHIEESTICWFSGCSKDEYEKLLEKSNNLINQGCLN